MIEVYSISFSLSLSLSLSLSVCPSSIVHHSLSLSLSLSLSVLTEFFILYMDRLDMYIIKKTSCQLIILFKRSWLFVVVAEWTRLLPADEDRLRSSNSSDLWTLETLHGHVCPWALARYISLILWGMMFFCRALRVHLFLSWYIISVGKNCCPSSHYKWILNGYLSRWINEYDYTNGALIIYYCFSGFKVKTRDHL